ncbi:MAG: hypothetical protein IT472_08990 [Thermomonas sp.]|uniref:hypothetical protein n=1 Tax=Thermomonas sp. TaxID=1971895 RepID=UPI002624CBE6|nr:hypothetical protein [Thermomonas sp.]MCC7097301.1 hypothetical protein [Thermomonas sp.]
MTIHIDTLDAGHIGLRLQLANGWTVTIPIPAEGEGIMPRCWASHDHHPRPGILKASAADPMTGDELVEFIATVATNPRVVQRAEQGEAA